MGKVLIIKQPTWQQSGFGKENKVTCAALTPLSQQNCYTLGDILATSKCRGRPILHKMVLDRQYRQ